MESSIHLLLLISTGNVLTDSQNSILKQKIGNKELQVVLSNSTHYPTIAILVAVDSVVTTLFAQRCSVLVSIGLFFLMVCICILVYFQINIWRMEKKRQLIPQTKICDKEESVQFYEFFSKNKRLESTHYVIDPSTPTVIQVGDV